MKYNEIKSIIKDDLGMSIKEFELAIGYKRNQLSNYSTKQDLPKCMSLVGRLLRVMVQEVPSPKIREALKGE